MSLRQQPHLARSVIQINNVSMNKQLKSLSVLDGVARASHHHSEMMPFALAGMPFQWLNLALNQFAFHLDGNLFETHLWLQRWTTSI